jgi:hypothetical protein
MRFFAVVLLFAVVPAGAQQTGSASPPSQAELPGHVTGHVYCSDTGGPARFASIQLMSEQSAKKPLLDESALGAGKDGSQGVHDFGSLLGKGLAAMMSGSNLSTLTAIDGNFAMDKVPPGTYYVIAQMAGYLSPISQFSQKERMMASDAVLMAVEHSAQKIVVQPNGTISIDIQLDRGAAISGRVRYDDGSPAPGVTPVLISLGKDGKWKEMPSAGMLPAATDDQGHYRIAGLPAGKYAVKAALPTMAASMGLGMGSISMHMNMGDALVAYSGDALWQKDIKPIELKAGDNTDGVDITFPINGLHVISGTVVAKSDGHAVNAGTVALEDAADKTQQLRMTTIGKDGSFQFNYVPDGAYRVEVTSAGDMNANSGVDTSNPLSLLLNAKDMKSLKSYGEADLGVTLPGNSEGLALQVPDASK